MAYHDVLTISDSGHTVVYQRDDSVNPNTGVTPRHRLKVDGTAYADAPQGRPCRATSSPGYMATTWDPFNVLGGSPVTEPIILRVVDVTPGH